MTEAAARATGAERVADPGAFVAENTVRARPPLLPELRLRGASLLDPLWQMSEDEMATRGLPPPYWAFAWAGGQALARYLLDHPATVAGRAVLDIGTGGGLVAIAAARAGAAPVRAIDIDPFAIAACRLNATENRVSVEAVLGDIVDQARGGAVALIGDLFYEQPTVNQVLAWCEAAMATGTEVLIGDPGRTYLPRDRLRLLATYRVESTTAIEDADVRRTQVFRLRPAA